MPKQYFVKRGDRVRGPLNGQQVKAALKSRKLHDADLISRMAEGPWRRISDRPASAAKRSLPTVTEYEVAKTMLGKAVARYLCPLCKAVLQSTEKELAGAEECPECSRQFLVTADALAELQADRRGVEEAREDVRRERQTKREEKQREKERQQQIRAQQRVEEQQRLEEELLLAEVSEEEEEDEDDNSSGLADAVDLAQNIFDLFG